MISCQEKMDHEPSFWIANTGTFSNCNYENCNFNRRCLQCNIHDIALYTWYIRYCAWLSLSPRKEGFLCHLHSMVFLQALCSQIKLFWQEDMALPTIQMPWLIVRALIRLCSQYPAKIRRMQWLRLLLALMSEYCIVALWYRLLLCSQYSTM